MAEGLTAQEQLTVEEFFRELKRREHPNVVLVSQKTAVKFLMARKFDVSRAIDLFQAYKNTRLKEGINNINPDEEPLRSELLSGKFTVLPGRDAKGAAIALFTARLHRPDITTHKAVLQAIIYQLDRAIESIQTQRDGLVFIYDMTSSTYGNFDYELCVKILNLLKGAFPARLKCVFIVSSPLWFRAPFAVLRLFVREKLRERVCTVKSHELTSHVPMESLPEHLGGSSKYNHIAWIQACVNSSQSQQNGDCLDSLFNSYTLDQNPSSDGLNSNCTDQTVTDNTKHAHNRCHENRTSNFHMNPNSLSNFQHWNGSVVRMNYEGNEKGSSANTNDRKPPPQSETPPDTPLHKHASADLNVPPLPQKSRPSLTELSIHIPDSGGMNVQELVQYVKKKKKKGIYQEYEEIRKEPPSGTFEYSKKTCNQIKNRYSDVLCLDQTRVKLNPVNDDDESSDYINASFMDGYRRKNTYIATQGPLPKTFGDFWRMVWEQKVLIIVMTTRVVERGRIKCGQYWPLEAGKAEEYGQYLIRNMRIEMFQDFKLSHLKVYNKEAKESRDVSHFLYMSWPDFGVPKSASAMLHFRAQVKTHHEVAVQAMGSEWNPPIVVHCSAGIGRTGTFCTLDICLSRLEDIGTVDINQTVKRMRTQRAFSIQTWDQYYFCYMAIIEYAQRRGLLAPVEWSDTDLETDSE
ncbi:tyrosine-protein phosphatase non-receptor type 9 [Polypterus senegalus]|uniref:tyrosine-protein phosphatase non-receptor type 9 n=1 Tax=Polypterus senegalus TaxID=55291 RepID=UPI00196354AC|nr:tyrosine-protein phosphatase non-receptor type 9 [Polypterus senegalus]